jgi:tetratricopeptide (TPR) repeat protein
VLRVVDELQRALQRQDLAALRRLIGELIAARAPMGAQWQALAQVAADVAELDLAREAIDLFVRTTGGTSAALYQKAAFLAQAGLWREADALLRTLPPSVPDPIANAYSRGIAALNLGRRDEARHCLEQVVAARPQAGTAWLGLTMAADLADEQGLADRLIAAQTAVDRGHPTDRAAYRHALGALLAARGEHARAFAAFAGGAEQMKALAPFDLAADRRQAEDAVRGYDAERIADAAQAQTEPTGRTIFVSGLPRSGTTLLEQALTAHSAVGAGAEIGALAVLASEVGGASHAALERHVASGGAAPAARLWHRWLDERFGPMGRVVDKSVDTGRYLGLVAALLPDAPLVWTTRDPLDRAWSCFRTNFMGGAVAWSYDLRDIAAHFRLEDHLLAQWQQILGDRLLIVPYEALVTDPEGWIRRVLDHCRLPVEQAAFAPHENHRAVATASMMQVRRPINRSGIGSAAPYRTYLAPFIDAYYG